MVDKIPTTTVNITTSDTMRQGQNYKINKKIWELIEESKNNGTDLEERLLALEESDIKEKMGYDNIPEGESLMSQIIELQEALDGNDEPQNNGNENIETNSRDITFTVTEEGDLVGSNYPVTVDGVTKNTDENSQVVFNLEDGTHTAKIVMDNGGENICIYYNDAIVTDINHTEQVLNCNVGREVSIRFVDKDTQELIEGVYYSCELIDVIADISHDSSYQTQTESFREVPFTFKVYSDETKSVLLDEKSIDRDDLEVTFEVPSPSQPHTLSFSVKLENDNPVSGAMVFAEWGQTSFTATTDSAGGCTMSDVPDGDYYMGVEHFDLISINEESASQTYGMTVTVDGAHTSFNIVVSNTQ